MTDSTPAAEYVCQCGHVLDDHERPRSLREPWGRCRVIVASTETRRCQCAEAWPVES